MLNLAEPLNLKAKRGFELAGAGFKRTCHRVYHFLVYDKIHIDAIFATTTDFEKGSGMNIWVIILGLGSIIFLYLYLRDLWNGQPKKGLWRLVVAILLAAAAFAVRSEKVEWQTIETVPVPKPDRPALRK
jgi:hypothetical protein